MTCLTSCRKLPLLGTIVRHFPLFLIPMKHISGILFTLLPVLVGAQPSGGPYGPMSQTYEVPKDAHAVYYVAPDGKSEVPGASLEAPTTIESAIEQVVTGDVIILRGGTYRTGDLILNQGITLQPYKTEKPVLKGTWVADEWEALANGLWRTKWERLFPSEAQDWWRREREGKRTPPYKFNNDMVFINGKFLQAKGWEGELDENSYTIDYKNGYIYIATDPTDKLVEITAHDVGLLRTIDDVHGKSNDHVGPIIKGIQFTQYAYRAIEIEANEPMGLQEPDTFGRDVVGTTLEDVTITFCSRVAGYFRGDNMVFRRCLISDTVTEGLYIIGSADVLLEKNIIARNNIEEITGYFPSAVKIFNQSYRVTCRDNLVVDHPNSNGIWYDVGNVDGVFINNWVEHCVGGFFFEISKGAVCAGNVFVECYSGVRVLNSSDVHVYQNTLINSMATFQRTPRSAANDHFGWHPTTGPDVDERDGHIFTHNLMVADDSYEHPLLEVFQSPELCGTLTKPQLQTLDYNVYARSVSETEQPLILWSPVEGEDCNVELSSLSELTALNPAFETNGEDYGFYGGQIVQSAFLKNAEVLPDFPGNTPVDTLPEEIADLLNWDPSGSFIKGAYPNRL